MLCTVDQTPNRSLSSPLHCFAVLTEALCLKLLVHRLHRRLPYTLYNVLGKCAGESYIRLAQGPVPGLFQGVPEVRGWQRQVCVP